MLTGRNIYLSCGTFEHPNYAAANANIEYATELSHKLSIPLHTGAHGHEFIAWNEELEQSLPAILTRIEPVSLGTPRKGSAEYYRSKLNEGRDACQLGYMAPTESSKAKERERFTPLSITPKPPWRP